ncbi:Hypothetical predicted protein [Paramuricea clavata]|uniref:Uncharacterized protein n=1 Tax=Paramuricea clavata TaxID=317549 RepID=A0A7D9EBB8_PARCT|nr:Hypothetical predicted protein [Paramuricea clavata]
MDSIEKIAHLKEKGLLEAFGIPISSESEGSESETDRELTDEVAYLPGSENPKSANVITTTSIIRNASSDDLLNILRNSDYNWLEFVNLAQENMKELHETAFQDSISDFYHKLPSLGISESDESSSDDIRKIQSPFDVPGQFLITKRRDALHRKATRDAKRKIAEQRFLKRRKSKKVAKILQDCPDIEKTIEDFVERIGAGADTWRQTGVITFDGNKKLEKKATFKRVKEHLEEKYQRSISYGTVVQLCIERNKRRRSALRYHGEAKVIQKKARKGFNIKYNPDSHWSNALYSDTLATHRLHGNLCVKGKETLAIRTDYVNKYPSTLQTTSYNFPGTETTGEIAWRNCMGVVKAPVLFSKNSAQNFADLEAISKNECSKPAFINPTTGTRKEIECVRVDGGYDEGPAHLETIHLIKGADNKAYQDENELLKVFLKGKKGEKEALERDHPEAYSKFQRIWQLCNNHLHKELPVKYVFYLTCCYEKTCIHKICKKGRPEKELTWYPNGPPISFFPIPRPDPERPHGSTCCAECKDGCAGHYLKPQALLQLSDKDTPRADGNCQPPSISIL